MHECYTYFEISYIMVIMSLFYKISKIYLVNIISVILIYSNTEGLQTVLNVFLGIFFESD